jgi:hypothetical protein
LLLFAKFREFANFREDRQVTANSLDSFKPKGLPAGIKKQPRRPDIIVQETRFKTLIQISNHPSPPETGHRSYCRGAQDRSMSQDQGEIDLFRTARPGMLPAVILLVWLSSVACQIGGIRGNGPLEPSQQRSIVRDQLLIHSDFYLPPGHRILDDLVNLRQDISHRLDIRLVEQPIEVFLFRDEKKFRRFIQRHSKLPDRRAFFVKQNQRLMVFSYWGTRAEEDLRHEVTHGYLHGTFDHLPLWIDEGIAEYFETNQPETRINRPHVHLLAESYRLGNWRPALKSLEQFNDNATLNQLEYAESWLWIHFLLEYNDQTRRILTNALQKFQQVPTSELPAISELLEQQFPDWRPAIINHLKSLAEI